MNHLLLLCCQFSRRLERLFVVLSEARCTSLSRDENEISLSHQRESNMIGSPTDDLNIGWRTLFALLVLLKREWTGREQ
ncbi:uncharacterized protein RCO7_15166 [Rhynchosporium graminicola]|uniref:Uncharacterized protein n=1 Tax=Rhynchosporium graminicola TaxID=2792576 RepID=A0A1E1LND9_9HELO|nr:uncharacterized protein RCO7_15166 [Rhynchosporium commune]